MIKPRLRGGERKSMARFREHFAGPRQLTAIAYRFASLIAPVAVIAFLGLLTVESHAGQFHIGHLGLFVGSAAAVPLPAEQLNAMAEEFKTFTIVNKTELDKHKGQLTEQASRLLAIEQKLTAPGGGRGSLGEAGESLGQLITKSDAFSIFKKGARSSGRIEVGNLHHKQIINATGLDQPLVPMYRVPGIVMPGLQRLTVRDLLPAFPVSSNMVAFAKETAATNAAAPQAGENVLKAESNLTFVLENSAVQTLANWIPASRQIIEDAPALEAYINARLLYFLKFQEEQQLLNGDGTGNNLSGLILNSTAFNTAETVSGDTLIDTVGRAINQVNENSNIEADGIVLNRTDWSQIQLIKNTLGNYIYSNPHQDAPANLWGLPVVPTKSMQRGDFLVGAFKMAAAIWDRDDATVELSREHSDFFIRNMVALLCESRLALTVFRSNALVYGSFPFGS